MVVRALLFGVGLLLLYAGAEGLVRGASRLARELGMSALVVGLTVVAFGTSAPELVVSSLASAAGDGGVAIGNVVGSNIANIALILGLSAMICPLRVKLRLIGREIPLMIGASLLLVPLLLDGRIGRWEAAFLLLAFAGYLAFVLRAAREAPERVEEAYGEFAATALSPGRGPLLASVGLVVGGLVALVAGAHLLVEAAVWFARLFGVSDLVIGLTLVAVGTSLPELATSTVAAFQRRADIAVGNIVGSNVFNVLAILGVSAAVRPLAASPSLLRFEVPVMVGTAVLLLPLARTRFTLQRWEGAVLLVGYGVFLALVLARSATAS